METLSLLFGLRARVARLPYIVWGLSLAVLKFGLDTLVVYSFTKKTWSPLGYVVPSVALRDEAIGLAPQGMHLLLAVLALPFLWVGLSMSVRRAADAGVPAWRGTLFLVPGLNYLVILLLSCLPSAASARWEPLGTAPYRQPTAIPSPPEQAPPIPPGTRAALLGVLAAMALGLSMIGLSVYGLGLYGTALFFVTPFGMGATSAAIYNYTHPRTFSATVAVAAGSVLLTGSAVLLFAIEGLLCLAMAAPIAMTIAIFGAAIGRAVVTSTHAAVTPLVLLAIPGTVVAEARLADPTPREVMTSIEVDAPPERVWPHVVGFSELEDPPAWFFRLGVAYPKRARIEGEGVGAVRRCEFSTGAFVEPITAWDPPHRLAFDVTSQPPSMTEWSPYGRIHAPHLEGYMKSRGGEFRLVPLPDGKTRIEGTTHYTLAIYPEIYWVPFAEALLHAIHWRVLGHIKHLSEDAARTEG